MTDSGGDRSPVRKKRRASRADLEAIIEAKGRLLERLMAVQEDERQRVARELHDETGQSLTSLLLGLKVMEKSDDLNEVRRQLTGLQAIASRLLESVHHLSIELRPTILDELGLIPALRAYAREYQARYQLPVEIIAGDLDGRLPGGVELTIYRIIQEALTNAACYAQASQVRVCCEHREGELHVEVQDDGVGFDPAALREQNSRPHLGLMGMRERAALIRGHLTVHSALGQGTRVSLDMAYPTT